MKKILIGFLFLAVLFSAVSAFALEVTANTDRDKFQYTNRLQFATANVAAGLNMAVVPMIASTGHSQYVVFKGFNATSEPQADLARIISIAVSGTNASLCTAGAATFDVTINGTVTGVKAVIEASPQRVPYGTYGSSGTQFAYTLQDRSDDRAPLGFNATSNYEANLTTGYAGYPYGRVTPLAAGDRIGVRVTTSNNFAPASNNWVVGVYVLE